MSNKKNSAMLTPKAKNTMDNVIPGEQSMLRKDFVKALIYPDEYQSRMPDELTQPTTLYRSVREFALTANMDGTVNAGKFSFAVKPILGDLASPDHYQVGMVDVQNGWPTNFNISSSYVSNNLYSDPRMDPMALPLLSSPNGTLHLQNVTLNPPTLAYVSDSGIDGWAYQIKQLDTSLPNNVQCTDVTYTSVGVQVPTTGPISLSPSSSSGTALGAVEYMTFFHLPSGQWSVNPNMRQNGPGYFTSTTNNLQFFVLSYDATTKLADGLMRFQYGQPPYFSGYFAKAGVSRIIESFNASMLNTNQALMMDLTFNYSSDGKHGIGFGWYVPLGFVFGSWATELNIYSTMDYSLPIPDNSGSLIKYRPVGLAALVTCTLPELTAGGNIVAYSAPPGDVDNYYYQTSGVMGPLQEWQNLARNNKGRNTHDGNFKDGCYVWTQPWDKNDTLLRTPSEVLKYPYQGIIVSGQVNPTVQLNGLVEIGRIRIVILYEYISDNLLFLGESCYGSSADLDWVLAYLGGQQHACENFKHAAMLKNIAVGAAKWVNKAVPVLRKSLDIASGIAKLAL